MTETQQRLRYFLGANSSVGFASLYEQWIDQRSVRAFYVIKGGPGCGKSTLMKRLAQRAEARGERVERILCSGDPDSLDGILLPEKGVALADGTAPHRLDPLFPGVTGHYVDLGAGYDRQSLSGLREEILAASDDCRVCWPKASQCFRAAAESLRRGRAPLHTEKTLEKAGRRAAGLLSRELRARREGRGRVSRRFLGGATCRGRLLLTDTVSVLCERGWLIRDDCGLADLLLRRLEAGFLEAGYDVISCPDPLRPERLAHLLVPDRSLAFLTGPAEGLDGFRTIRTDSLVEPEAWQEGRSFLQLSLRVAEDLVEEGMDHLARAKEAHDRLEALYRPYVDFSLADRLAETLDREIAALPAL